MMRFINEKGGVFNGDAPYIHWIEGQLSIGMWHTLTLMGISDTMTITTSELPEDSPFRFIDPHCYDQEGVVLDLDTISKRQITSEGETIIVSGVTWYVHQILMVCESDVPGEYIEDFVIHSRHADTPVRVGADLYGENESFSINLSNRGMELPMSIRKAFLDNNIHDDLDDYALINRKFKELVSNFIDIADNRGSYVSLVNSLKWFEWGEGAKLYEIWKDDNTFLEKDLKPILSNKYKDLLYTHKKTTHLSLVVALQQMTDNIDNERNPILEDIAYEWSRDELALKVSILGAFFERYFMPIHLDLKRVCVEAMIFTNQIKLLNGSYNNHYHFHTDYLPIDIQMDHVITLGNPPRVAVGRDTMFGKRIGENINPDTSTDIYFIEPIGVDVIDDIDYVVGQTESINNETDNDLDDLSNGIATFFMQFKSGIGAVIPITVSVDLPEDDGLTTEILTVYEYENSQQKLKEQVTERRLIMSSDGKATFTFNLVSDKEEKIAFSLALYSLSGHAWTGASSYETIDVSGSKLDVCIVSNTNNSDTRYAKYRTVLDWVGQDGEDIKNPYASLYAMLHGDWDPGIDIDNPGVHSLSKVPLKQLVFTQYIPCEDIALDQYNQLIVVENPINQSTNKYSVSWINNQITERFWVVERIGEEDGIVTTENNPRYVILIAKSPNWIYRRKLDFLAVVNGLEKSNVKRFELIYIPQLHDFAPIESRPATIENYTFSKYDLLCVIPQFKKNLEIEPVSWTYTNKTTLETIETNKPIVKPIVADKRFRFLNPGYWTVTLKYKIAGSGEIHTLTRNSAFKIV